MNLLNPQMHQIDLKKKTDLVKLDHIRSKRDNSDTPKCWGPAILGGGWWLRWGQEKRQPLWEVALGGAAKMTQNPLEPKEMSLGGGPLNHRLKAACNAWAQGCSGLGGGWTGTGVEGTGMVWGANVFNRRAPLVDLGGANRSRLSGTRKHAHAPRKLLLAFWQVALCTLVFWGYWRNGITGLREAHPGWRDSGRPALHPVGGGTRRTCRKKGGGGAPPWRPPPSPLRTTVENALEAGVFFSQRGPSPWGGSTFLSSQRLPAGLPTPRDPPK